MPTEISNANPFGGLAQGGGGISSVGGSYNPPQTNFLGAILDARAAEQTAQLRQQEIDMAKAKLLQEQQQMQGDKMMSGFLMKNTDTSGDEPVVNMPGFLTDIASHPLTAGRFDKAYSYALESNKTSSEIMKNRLDAAHTRASALGRTAYGVLEVAGQEGRDVEPGDVAQGLMNEVTLGNLTVGEAQKLTANLPPKGPKLNAAVKQFALEADQEAQSLQRVQGTTNWEKSPDSSGQVLVQTGPGGQRTNVPGTYRADVLTPEQRSQTVDVQTTGDDGSPQTIQMPREEYLRRNNMQSVLPGDRQSGVEGQPIAPSPSARQAQESAAQVGQNVDYEKDVKAEAKEANFRSSLLRQAKSDLGKTKTGASVPYYKVLAGIAQGMGAPNDVLDRIVGGDLAALDRLGGLNTLLAPSNFKAISEQPNRDLGQNEFERMIQSSFSTSNQPGANKFVVNYMLGAQELKLNRAEALDSWKRAGKKVEDFSQAWTKKEKQLIERGILRDPDNMISQADYKKGKRVEGY